jgi:hypothetical protein
MFHVKQRQRAGAMRPGPLTSFFDRLRMTEWALRMTNVLRSLGLRIGDVDQVRLEIPAGD